MSGGRVVRRLFVFVLLSLLLGACSAVNPYYDASRPHHTPEGFRNNYAPSVNKSRADLLRWMWESWRNDLPRPPATPTPVQAPDLAAIEVRSAARAQPGAPSQPAITWIGHASVLVQAGRLNVLTDPIFSERASFLSFIGPKRAQAPGLALKDLPPIDVVLISHNHYDHLDKQTVVDLAARSSGKIPTLFLVPLGVKPWFTSLGITNVIEMDWWDQHLHKGVEFNFTPVQHWSARSLGDRSQTLWGGFAVFAPDFHWYYTGDTGYSKDFSDTRERFAARHPGGFDLALIPVGGYEPRWFMKEQHINPAEAVQVHKDLGARRSVGVHWGTFNLTDESLDQPPRELALARQAQGLRDEEFSVMRIGETRPLPARAGKP